MHRNKCCFRRERQLKLLEQQKYKPLEFYQGYQVRYSAAPYISLYTKW